MCQLACGYDVSYTLSTHLQKASKMLEPAHVCSFVSMHAVASSKHAAG